MKLCNCKSSTYKEMFCSSILLYQNILLAKLLWSICLVIVCINIGVRIVTETERLEIGLLVCRWI